MEKEEDYGLEEVHKELFELLSGIDQICRENKIQYSLHGGTLLGAVRNHHFIPWDDDADVSMTRVNFEKFKDAVKSNTTFSLDTVGWVPRFHYKKSDLGTSVDVFVWDYISENKLVQSLKILLLRFIQGTIKNRDEVSIAIKTHGVVGKILSAFAYIVGLPFTRKFKLKIYDFVGKKAFIGNQKFIHRSNDQYRGIKYIHDGDYMDEYTDIILEGRSFMINKRKQEFLEREYGKDYLIPPPLSERRSNHENTAIFSKEIRSKDGG